MADSGRSPARPGRAAGGGSGTVRQRRTGGGQQQSVYSSIIAFNTECAGGGGGGAARTGAGSGGMWRFYTEDSSGVKIGPVPVLVMSLVFIASVFMLHIWGKYTRAN